MPTMMHSLIVNDTFWYWKKANLRDIVSPSDGTRIWKYCYRGPPGLMSLPGGFSYAPMGWTWDAPKFLYHASMVCLHDLLRGVSIQIHGIIVFRQILVKLIYKHLIISFFRIIYAAKPLKGLLQIAAKLRIWISPFLGCGAKPYGDF